MARCISRAVSITFAWATLAGTTYADSDKSSSTSTTRTSTLSSATSSSSTIASNLNFAVPEPVSAPGTNTSSGCGKELDSEYKIDKTRGPFTFDTSDEYGRNYTIYVPKYYDVDKASPLIFALAGNGQTYDNIEEETELSDEANNPYAITVFVQGVQLGFVSNPGYGATEDATFPDVNDLDFMNDFIDDLTDRFCVDTGRIWAVGHSNGGGLTNVMACDKKLSTRITAFAANSGAFYTNHTDGDPDTVNTDTTVQSDCTPGRAHVPYIEFHGTDDETIAYDGSDDHSSYGVRLLPDIQHWASSWAVRNGYTTDNVTSRPDDDVKVYQWGGPDNLGVVTHYRLSGWIHDYARKSAGAPIDATPIIMEFFYNQTNFTTDTSTNSSDSGDNGDGSTTGSSPAASSSSSSSAATTASIAATSTLALIASLVLALYLC